MMGNAFLNFARSLATEFQAARRLRAIGGKVRFWRLRFALHFWCVMAVRMKKLQISNEVVADILLLKRLAVLDLSHSNCNDHFLALLASSRVQVLILTATHITDHSVAVLSSMESLLFLSLVDTSVSATEVEKLREQLPNCQVMTER